MWQKTNNFRTCMNGHKSDYVAGRLKKMDNKLFYDHPIHHNIDYFKVDIVN